MSQTLRSVEVAWTSPTFLVEPRDKVLRVNISISSRGLTSKIFEVLKRYTRVYKPFLGWWLQTIFVVNCGIVGRSNPVWLSWWAGRSRASRALRQGGKFSSLIGRFHCLATCQSFSAGWMTKRGEICHIAGRIKTQILTVSFNYHNYHDHPPKNRTCLCSKN